MEFMQAQDYGFAQQALRHAYLLALVPPAAALLGVASPMFAVEGLVLNG